ncbi:hypothetical protein GGX14DRAFT_700060 [Mycena pura]|uniref:Uncharacterized protein n=1 Tax=Mycena pura TaxID=153505 RepID=A0AAD6V358_9AGAR|nr:hypothetical protein GGX14DRAFT_700060 [Mycena pura]
MDYHQIGGFHPAISTSWKERGSESLGQKVYRLLPRNADGSLELLLGIKTPGTSCLLVTEVDAQKHLYRERSLRYNSQFRSKAGDFESLSPILFLDCSALEKKLEGFQQPAGKKNTKGRDVDISSQNKAYQDGQSHGIQRGQFENSRILYKLLHGQIDTDRFDLKDTSWCSSIRVYSFCYNVWLRDTRSPEERRLSPKILDLAWGEASTSTLDGNMKTARDIVYSNNKMLENPGEMKMMGGEMVREASSRKAYEYGDSHGATEICDHQALAGRVQRFFGQFTRPTQHPAILLVHDEQLARNVLLSLGVDVSQWDPSLKNLLRHAQNDLRRRREDPRGRSASPRPHDRSARRNSPPPRRLYAPVYVVDVQSMFTTLFGTSDRSQSVPAIAKHLGILPAEDKGWCAGNEVWLVPKIFCAMAHGSSIDEQKQEWPSFTIQAASDEYDDDVSDYGLDGSDSE